MSSERSIERTGTEATGEARTTSGRGALIALAVALVGTVAFGVGLRKALVRLPPERAVTPATTPDSTRTRRFAPPAPNQPDEYPRLR